VATIIIVLVRAKKNKMSIAKASGMTSWTYQHGDNTIVVKNTAYKLMLLVNGQVQDTIKGFHLNQVVFCLKGNLESGEAIVAVLEAKDFDMVVSVTVGMQIEELSSPR